MATLLCEDTPGHKRFVLFRNITRIGSDPAADIPLCGDLIAADHAQVLREGEDFVLSSMGRGRPLRINGRKEKRIRLSDGDLIEIGEFRLRFSLRDTPSADEENSAAFSQHILAYQQIVRFSEKLMRNADLNGLLVSLMDAVVELSQADKGFLILFEEGHPKIKLARNMSREPLIDAAGELSDSIIQKVIREQQPVIVSDARSDNEFKHSHSVLNLRLYSVMCIPLLEAETLLGIIYLGSARPVNLFEPKTLQATMVFAAQASLLIRNAMLLDTLRTDNALLRQAAESKCFGDVIGCSDKMQEIYNKIRKAAPTDVSVLISGETGTGKELIAAEIHRRSARAKGPFVVINCGAIAETLLESELFGHVRGAFTGAVATREGRFQAAHGGTLFLDEIGEMPSALQVKLLRALQERVITKVGDSRQEPVDIRVIAATNKDIEAEIRKGTFRDDLYYRLNVIGIHLPPLRERGEDFMLIACYLLKRYGETYKSKVKGFSPQCALLMNKYAWPGNIRQLDNRIKKAVIMAEHMQLSPEDLDLSVAELEPIIPLNQAKEAFQRQYIDGVLARNNGNRTKTAHDLGVDPRTIFRHLERED